VIFTGTKITREDGYTTDLELSKAEELMPFDCTEIQDTFIYYGLTAGSMTRTETLIGSVTAVKEVTIAVGSVGNEFYSDAELEIHRTSATTDSTYPSDTLIGKTALNCSNKLTFGKPKFSTDTLKMVINTGATSNKLVCLNIRYYSKNY